MAFALYAANEGYLDAIEVLQIVGFEQAMQSYLKLNYSDLLEAINANPEYNDEVASTMKDALDDFVKNGTW